MVQKGEGKGMFLPCNVVEMGHFITQICIGFFNHTICKVGETEESIHQIFENSIAEVVC